MKCYGCLKESNTPYCAKCKKNLFNGRNIKPLDFDKTKFYEIKNEMTNRMSLSGVQDKISLTFGDNNNLIPTATDGRYLLKPIPRIHETAINLKDMVGNEHLSMQISKHIFKIPTAESGLIEFKDGELAYITKRFDYSISSTEQTIVKLDQEDFAAVLQQTKDSHGDDYKYDSSYEVCANNIKKFVAAYIPSTEDFYKRVILNYLIGNGDAHLKNFSLIRDVNRTDYSLSPNYDILYTRYHLPKESGDMALELFNSYESEAFGAMGYYTLQDFEDFAKIINIKDKRIRKVFYDILKSSQKVYKMIENSYMTDEAKQAYKNNYENRLNNCLCYSIESYPFKGVALSEIRRYKEMSYIKNGC